MSATPTLFASASSRGEERAEAVAPDFVQVALFASRSLRMKNAAELTSGDVVVNEPRPAGGPANDYELILDPDATTPAGFSVKADRVRLKNRAVVGGDLHYNALRNQGQVDGALITPLALPVFADLPRFVSQPPAPGSAGVAVSEDGFVVLPPGDYGDVEVDEGGTLVLLGGIYNVRSIELDERANLLFATPTEVRVERELEAESRVRIGPEGPGELAAHQIVFYVAGGEDDEASGDLAVELGNSCLVTANFYAPAGTIRIGQRTDAVGAFLGRDLLVENQARVTLDSFFFNRPPEAADDSATVDEGGTVALLDSGEASLLANDLDPDGDPLTVVTTPVSGPAHGKLALADDGTFSYTHDGSETASDEFVYAACDDAVPPLCDNATVTLVIVPVNDPPQAVDDALTVVQGGTRTVLDSGESSVLANDVDPDGPALEVDPVPVSGPLFGSLELNADGTFVYTHDGSENFADQFVYQVCDGADPALCDTATVTIAVRSPARITVAIFGLGEGQVVSDPAGIDCPGLCSATFTSTSVLLNALPGGDSTFGGYTGDPDCADGIVETDADKLCFARFNLVTANAVLTVALDGDGSGRVISTPSGIDCPGSCSATFAIPTRVDLTQIADPGSVFAGWSGDAQCAGGSVPLFTNATCVATFTALPPPPETRSLTLQFVGAGAGAVSSSPSGLLCSEDCTVAFPVGTTVTLFGRPETGTLDGWGGDCGGSGFSTLVTLDEDRVCTVSFTP